MAKTNVTPRNEKTSPTTDKPSPPVPECVFYEPVVDLLAAAQALTCLADKLDCDQLYGEANIARLVGVQVSGVANFIDDNNWKSEGAA